MLVCSLLYFTQSISDPNYSVVTGLYYIGVVGLNFAVHLSVILLGTLHNMKLLSKKKGYCRTRKVKKSQSLEDLIEADSFESSASSSDSERKRSLEEIKEANSD